MESLINKKCVPCDDQAPLNKEEIEKYIEELSEGWEVFDDKKIAKNFKFKDFKEVMEFVNNMADIAEEENHHPDITIHYNKVEITLWTHKIGGLSENDFILAAKIDNIG